LAELFSTRFVAAKRDRKISIHIAKIQQAKGEDLKEYVITFNQEAIFIPDLQDGVAMPLYSMDCSRGDSSFSLLKARFPLWQMR